MTSEHISSHYGVRTYPGTGVTYHEGIDIAFPKGTKIFSCENSSLEYY